MTNNLVVQELSDVNPAAENPPAAEGHPCFRLGICRAESAANIDLIIPESFVYVSKVCD